MAQLSTSDLAKVQKLRFGTGEPSGDGECDFIKPGKGCKCHLRNLIKETLL